MLQVISRLDGRSQPVLETLVENAARLRRHRGRTRRAVRRRACSGFSRSMGRRRRTASLAAARDPRPDVARRWAGRPRRRTVQHVSTRWPIPTGSRSRRGGSAGTDPCWRCRCCREATIGVIIMWRTEVRRVHRQADRLLATFADQAVIAIENARLLTELQAKNADLTEALEQQTATAEILRVISRSPTDIQPVLDAVVESAVTAVRGGFRQRVSVDGELLTHGAITDAPRRSGRSPRLGDRTRPGRSSGSATGDLAAERGVRGCGCRRAEASAGNPPTAWASDAGRGPVAPRGSPSGRS